MADSVLLIDDDVDVLRAIDYSLPYRASLIFYGAYPIGMACVWIVLSVAFARRRERRFAPRRRRRASATRATERRSLADAKSPRGQMPPGADRGECSAGRAFHGICVASSRGTRLAVRVFPPSSLRPNTPLNRPLRR